MGYEKPHTRTILCTFVLGMLAGMTILFCIGSLWPTNGPGQTRQMASGTLLPELPRDSARSSMQEPPAQSSVHGSTSAARPAVHIPNVRGAERFLRPEGIPEDFDPICPPKSVAVIVTQYLRSNLKAQLKALYRQTVQPHQIYIVQNSMEPRIRKMGWKVPDVQQVLKEFPKVMHVDHRRFNSRFFGRFALGLYLSTEYVMVMDDDLIPDEDWIKTSLETSLMYNAIVCETGRLFKPGDGDSFNIGIVTRPTAFPVEVDYGGHTWFFKREWLHYMWALEPVTLLTCEDAHLSISAYLLGNITTYVPTMPAMNTTEKEEVSGGDVVAQHKNRKRYPVGLRTRILKYWYSKGWTPAVSRGVTTEYKVWWLNKQLKLSMGY